jgi:hypothetical protein
MSYNIWDLNTCLLELCTDNYFLEMPGMVKPVMIVSINNSIFILISANIFLTNTQQRKTDGQSKPFELKDKTTNNVSNFSCTIPLH